MSSESGPRKLSRREFAAVPACLAGAALTGFAQSAPLTAGQVIERIKEHLGVPWRGGPTDTLKTGDDHTPVTGVATTVMSTFDVIKPARTNRAFMSCPRCACGILAKDVERRLRLPAIRVVGDPKSTLTRAALMQGAAPFHASTVLSRVDVVVAGEQREWEGVEYAFDANTAGQRKGLILIGHWVSEDLGMRLCADWLKTFVPEVPVEWIPAGDPFWRP